jgi:tRNA/tmRNA/rRNA uracil-C5-methylase (TrmA/RlmC/RlmD family)/alkylated DNA repair dioxygenase AlkB
MASAIDFCLPNKDLSYADQFKMKQDFVRRLFSSEEITYHESIHTNYRNKLRFTVGLDYDYSKINIGYNNPKFKKSLMVSARDFPHLSDKMRELLVLFEDYMNEKQVFKNIPYDKKIIEERFVNLYGNINFITSFNVAETMIIIGLDKVNNRETIPELVSIYTDLFNTFRPKITSFYINIDANTPSLQYNKPYVLEKLEDFIDKRNFEFRRTESSFFQTNTYMTSIMYSRIKELVRKYSTNSDIIFDLCCGTGTIGIYCASLCNKVIGIDTCQSSIDDANRNAKLNDVTNCNFICDKIENVFDSLLSIYKPLNKFIIIDPPRSGLHGDMTKYINNSGCNYVIYVSCNQETMMRDIAMMPNYKITDKDMYDMYPMTDHVEVSCVLERNEKIELIKPFEHVVGMFAENYFEELKNEITWKQDYFTLLNGGVERVVRERRLTGFQSESDAIIKYSDKEMIPEKFSSRVEFVKKAIEERFKLHFDSCLINYYVDQEDYMRFHKDDVGVTKSPNIITVSFGETREFQVRLRADKEIKYYFELKNGDVFRMFDNCQDLYDHSIPPTTRGVEKGGRISLTFRVLNA